MKRFLTVTAALLLSTAVLRADININLAGGNLYNSNGTLQQEGTLVQLLVSRTDNIFNAPSPSSFTGDSADDLVLKSFTINSGDGFFAEVVNFTLSGTLGPGDQLLLRWFPTLTLADSAPGAGTQYGEYRTDLQTDGSDSGWFVPSDGAIIGLNFLTEMQGGSNPESRGFANLTVVPEPSTYALFAAGLGTLAIVRRRQRRNK